MQTVASSPLRLSGHLSFKGNLKHTRYGWLRLTPAYSVHLVAEVLESAQLPSKARVLDPFCGTGTTALVCAERGLRCDSTDINPFLLWLAGAKTRPYTAVEIAAFQQSGRDALEPLLDDTTAAPWLPDLHQIEKWWDAETLSALGRLAHFIADKAHGDAVKTLLQITFCRVCIEASNASFGHQSMSFKKSAQNGAAPLALALFADSAALQNLAARWQSALCDIAASAQTPVAEAPRLVKADARRLADYLGEAAYDCVVTSPPYPNRMSYIRELRPYMYWLGYLQNGRDAGELDWQAIGGTWGCATSNLNRWQSNPARPVPFTGFDGILQHIGAQSDLLARYVHKYFEDITGHVAHLWRVTKPGATIHYIVGNSKFYEVMLPVQEIYAALFAAQGFAETEIKTIRKRTSKKELFEFIVAARRP